MTDNTKFKINILNGDIEIEGSETFVSTQISNLKNFIDLFQQPKTVISSPQNLDQEPKPPLESTPEVPSGTEQMTFENFGEWITKFPKDIKQTEKLLAAGYFVQRTSKDNAFETGQANALLKTHGVKLTNAADCAQTLVETKDIFVEGKRGKIIRYRLSKPAGEDRIRKLLVQQ
jgi:hypothetical protein